MAANTLKKITARAKHIRKTHGGTWKAAIKKAGAEYRAGKIHGVKKTVRKKVAKRRKAIRRVKILHAAEGKALRAVRGVRSTFQAAAIGRLTTTQHISHAKEKIAHEIGTAEMSKFKAKTKRAKKKIAKRVTALKQRYRKLC